MDWVEIIGIVGSVLVLISFLMKDILVIRIINIVGSVVFIAYGIIIGAMATWFVNAALIVVHIIYIIKELNAKKSNKDKTLQTTELSNKTVENENNI